MRLALDIADAIHRTPDGIDLGPTDAEMCARALRFYAGRWGRRASMTAVFIVASIVSGVASSALALHALG